MSERPIHNEEFQMRLTVENMLFEAGTLCQLLADASDLGDKPISNEVINSIAWQIKDKIEGGKAAFFSYLKKKPILPEVMSETKGA